MSALTLDWLLARDDLDLRLIGDQDPAEVVIEWVHSIELPDPSRWLAGGELVLTTGLRLPRARAEQAAYARRLADAGVAVLGFGSGVRWEAIPPALVSACAELELPLVEVPLPTPFVAVTQAIARRVAELQYESVERTVEFQRRLTSAALHTGIAGVVRELAGELSGGVLLLDAHRHELESARCTPGLSERVRRELGRRAERARTSLRIVDQDGSTELQSLDGRTGALGWLVIESPVTLSTTDRVLLNQAVSILTLLLDSPVELLNQRRGVGMTVLDLLLDPTHAENASVHLPGLGLDPSDQLTVLVCAHVSDSAARTLLASLDRVDAPRIATTNAAPALCVLVRTSDVELFVEHLRHRLADSREGIIGVSAPVSPAEVSSGLVAATYAAESARWRHERVGRHDDLTISGLLADESVRTQVEALTSTPLDRIRAHRALTESLEIYLRTNGSWETASRMLGVHRHTLRNRMAKVEELTGLSLDVAENRAMLLLGLMR